MQQNVNYTNQNVWITFWHSKPSTPQSWNTISPKFVRYITQGPKCNTVKHTLQLKMFPNAENVSYIALLSILLSKFFMKTFPTPDLRSEGSRWDHIMRMGRPFIMSKFMVSSARSAKTNKLSVQWKLTSHHKDLRNGFFIHYHKKAISY